MRVGALRLHRPDAIALVRTQNWDVAPDLAQAVLCRRRHQPRRPAPAKIRRGKPAPAMGPGTAPEKAFTSKPRIEKFTISPEAMPLSKGLTNPSNTPELPLIKRTEATMLPLGLSAGAPVRMICNVSLQQGAPASAIL